MSHAIEGHIKPLYYLHIPKTAGTSVIDWLKITTHRETCSEGLWSLLLQRNLVDIRDYELYCGHFYWYLEEYLGIQLDTITFLRNPVDRAFSHYRHILRDTHHYFHKRVARHSSFKEFMLDPVTQPLVRNFQVRSLSSNFRPWEMWNKKNEASSPRYYLEQYIETHDYGLDEQEAFIIAKDRLLSCKTFGIVERMTDSVLLLTHELDLSTNQEIKSLNVDQVNAKLPISQNEQLMLQELLRFDIELYAFALQLFDARIAMIKSNHLGKMGESI